MDLREHMHQHDPERTEALHGLLADWLDGRPVRRRALPLKLDDFNQAALEAPWLLDAERAAAAGPWGPFFHHLFAAVRDAHGELSWPELARVTAEHNEGSLFMGRRHGQRGVLRWHWLAARLPGWIQLAQRSPRVTVEVISRVVVGAIVSGPVPIEELAAAWAGDGRQALRRLELAAWSGSSAALLTAFTAEPWPQLTELSWPARLGASDEAVLRAVAPALRSLQQPRAAEARPLCSPSHALCTANLIAALHPQLARERLFATGLPVQAPGLRFWPDVSLVRGEPELDADGALCNPTLIAEVLSPQSEGDHRGRRFERMSQLASVEEVLLLDWRTPLVQRLQRDGEQWRLTMVRASERLRLASVAATLDVDTLYTGVRFPQE